MFDHKNTRIRNNNSNLRFFALIVQTAIIVREFLINMADSSNCSTLNLSRKAILLSCHMIFLVYDAQNVYYSYTPPFLQGNRGSFFYFTDEGYIFRNIVQSFFQGSIVSADAWYYGSFNTSNISATVYRGVHYIILQYCTYLK